MGWSRGAELLDDVWSSVVEHISEDKKSEVAINLIDLFEYFDMDNAMECDLFETACLDPFYAAKQFIDYSEEEYPNWFPSIETSTGKGWWERFRKATKR